MHIFLVTNGYPPTAYGGVEIYSYDLANKLIDKGYQITIFCRESNLALPDYQVIDNIEGNIRVIRVVNDFKGVPSAKDQFTNYRIDDIFQKYLVETIPDIIHFNHFIALSANLPKLAAIQHVPFVTTLHDYWPICHRIKLIDWKNRLCPGPKSGGDCHICGKGSEEDPQVIVVRSGKLVKLIKAVTTPRMRNWIRSLFFRKTRIEPQSQQDALTHDLYKERYDLFKEVIISSQRILVPTDYVRKQYSANGYPASRIEVIPLGVNISKPTRTAIHRPDQITFAVLGSIIWTKGIHVILKAFEGTSAGNIRLRIFGREDIEPDYTKEVRQLAAGDQRIEFMGPFSPAQRAEIFEQIDVVVIPSIFPETFSLVAREALLTGKPVIASHLGALAEVIVERVNGFLFPPEDVQELQSIISEIAECPAILDRLNLPGPKPIDTVDDHACMMERLYQEVIAKNRSDG